MRIIGVPKTSFSDIEGAIVSNEFIRVLNENSIKQITTLNHAPYAEVFIRTMNRLIHDRLQGQDLKLDRWIDVQKQVLSKYSLSVHYSINMNPYQARQPRHKMQVYFNNWAKAKNYRIYKPLSVGDSVRIMIKKTTKTKATDPKWMREIYRIIGKNGNEYLINENNRRKLYLKHELREV